MQQECCDSFVGLKEFLDPRLFKALCDPTRLAILAGLAEAAGPRAVSQIAAGRPVDVSVVSRHLGVLRDAGVVEATRRGKEVLYQVRYQGLSRSLRACADAIDRCCPPVAPDKENQDVPADQDA